MMKYLLSLPGLVHILRLPPGIYKLYDAQRFLLHMPVRGFVLILLIIEVGPNSL